MRTGKSLVELATEIQRQAESKVDLLVKPQAIDLEYRDGVYHVAAGDHDFGVADTGHDQIGSYLDIPSAYYRRLRSQHPDLLVENVNTLFKAAPVEDRRMLRTLDGRARALLSDRFRTLDHSDLLEAILPAAHEAGLKAISTEVTERRLYLQMVSPRLEGEVKKGDLVQFGLTISNSEIGGGSLSIESLFYRLVCLNGMVGSKLFRKAHLGGRKQIGEVDVSQYLSVGSQRLQDAALFAAIRDTVKGLLTEEAFQRALAPLRDATERKIEADPVAAVEVVARKVGLNDGERGSVLRHLIEGNDLSAWGVGNAVTRLAHDVEDYDRSVELERAGMNVIELPRSEWREIAEAATAKAA